MKKITKKGKQVDLKKAYSQKMDKEELQLFLHFKSRGAIVPPKKGKGSYNRKKEKKYVASMA